MPMLVLLPAKINLLHESVNQVRSYIGNCWIELESHTILQFINVRKDSFCAVILSTVDGVGSKHARADFLHHQKEKEE
jgi:hypothetical protein